MHSTNLNAMRNLIISYRKMPVQMRETLKAMYPDGYEEHAFEILVPGKEMIYKALRVTIDGVNYLVKLDERLNTRHLLTDED